MTFQIKEQYLDVSTAAEYDSVRFSGFVGRSFNSIEKRALSRILAHVRRNVDSPNILDAPCGTGRITELWLEQGLRVTGGDISPAMLDVARRRCSGFGDRATFQVLDLERLELPDASFDLVTCIRLFHHIGTVDRTRIIKELARVSSRYVMVNVSYSSPYYRFRRSLKRLLRQGVSRTSSTWEEIQNEARDANLRVARTAFILRGISENLVLLLEKLPCDVMHPKS